MKPKHRGEALKKYRALSGVRIQAIGALAQGFTNRATPARERIGVIITRSQLRPE